MSGPTPFEQMGGADTFEHLVDGFYDRVQRDDVLAPMYPAEDWEGARWRLAAFLAQYWGGPTEYSDRRGHPMLRARHTPFRVDAEARTRWLTHMRSSLDELALPAEHDAALWDYLKRAAFAMQNVQEEP